MLNKKNNLTAKKGRDKPTFFLKHYYHLSRLTSPSTFIFAKVLPGNASRFILRFVLFFLGARCCLAVTCCSFGFLNLKLPDKSSPCRRTFAVAFSILPKVLSSAFGWESSVSFYSPVSIFLFLLFFLISSIISS